jgi:hypothetical protein
MRPSSTSPAERLALSEEPLKSLVSEIVDCLDELAFSDADCPGLNLSNVDPAPWRYLDGRLAELERYVGFYFSTCSASRRGALSAMPCDTDSSTVVAEELVKRVGYLRELLLYAPMSPIVSADMESRFDEFVLTLAGLDSTVAASGESSSTASHTLSVPRP